MDLTSKFYLPYPGFCTSIELEFNIVRVIGKIAV